MSAAHGVDRGEPRAFKASQRKDEAGRFRAAARHSRRVHLLRIGIPAALVLVAVLLALATWLNPLRLLSRLPVSIGDVVVSGTKIKMENPKLSGFTRDSRRYDFTAGAAAQDLTRPGVIELQEITAIVEMGDKSPVTLSAKNGVFDTKKELLKLDQNIVVTSSNYEGFFDEAAIDTRTGNVLSEKPVKLKMLNGTVDANRFELIDGGDLIRFENGVVVNMRLENASGDSQAGTAP
ncbi:MAG: LPS export ABC transporter periplasmic protein LptC [Xanthobacteraceae bacterium]